MVAASAPTNGVNVRNMGYIIYDEDGKLCGDVVQNGYCVSETYRDWLA